MSFNHSFPSFFLNNFIMTENDVYSSFRNEQANGCNFANQNILFYLEKYGPYLDKIRFIVPSLEYRIYSLLEEFVYSTNSQWAKQFPCFKKFIDAIVMWKDPLNKIAENDIKTVEEIMRHIVECTMKDDLITCFLDSVILHHRLKKICRDLDALGIEENILKNLNIWDFINERSHLLNCNCFTNTAMNCNSNIEPCVVKSSIEKIIKMLEKKFYNTNGCMKPTTSKEEQQIINSNKNYIQRRKDNLEYYSTYITTKSRNNNINKMNKFFNQKSHNTKSKKKQSNLKLKITVHNAYLNDLKCLTFSSFNVTRLSLPCKSKNLTKRIFEANPSLTESCMIVMKQKFEDSLHNVCSCLNSILEKLDVKLTKTLCLNCDIYPEYISFKLKISNIKKYLFVTRVPICQNVRKYTIQQGCSIFSLNDDLEPSIEIKESKCLEQCEDDDKNFDNTFEFIDEEIEKFDTCYSQVNQDFIKDTCVQQNKKKDINKKTIADKKLKNIENIEILSYNNSSKDINEETNTTSCIDNSKEKNKENCRIFSTINSDVEICKRRIPALNNSTTKTDTSKQIGSSVNCTCLLQKKYIERSDENKNIFSKDFSRITSNECDCISLSNKELDLENKISDTCSIASFIQNSENDKQLVELNYNHFLNSNAIDKHLNIKESNTALNSTKVEFGCNSCCSCQRDDFTNVNDISKKSVVSADISQDSLDVIKTYSICTDYSKTVQTSSRNNSLTISVEIPESIILSKGINVDTYYSPTVCLTSDDDKNTSIILGTSVKCNKIADFPVSIACKKKDKIHSDKNKEIFNVENKNFITSLKRFSTSKKRFRYKGSRNSSFLGNYLHAEKHSTSSASLYCHSFATSSEFVVSNEENQFQKFDGWEKSSKICECGKSRSSIRNVTATRIKDRTTSHKYSDDCHTEIQPQIIFAMTKFCNSIDKSVSKIKHLIRAKLGKILFRSNINNDSKLNETFCGNKEFSENIKKRKINSRYMKQDYNTTSCSICDCYRQSYTSSRASSNAILSVCKVREKRTNSKGICGHGNFHQCNFKRSNITISSQSTRVSLIENDSKYLNRCMCKCQKRDNSRISKQHIENRCKTEQVQYEFGQQKNKIKDRDTSIINF